MIHDGPPPEGLEAPPQRALTLHRPAPAAIDKQQMKQYLAGLRDPEALKLQQELAAAYDAAVHALIGPNDVQKEGAREFKKKSAWRKIARYFGISTEVVKVDREFIGKHFLATVTVRGVAPWGQALEAVGACSTDEATGRRTITIADAIATAGTRANNRAISDLVAMGEVSAEEIRKGEGEARDDREMTLEEAVGQPWPWKGRPKDMDGKPLGDAPTKLLLVVQDWVDGKLEKGERTRALVMLDEAVGLILASRDDVDAATAELEAQRAPKPAAEPEPREAPTPTAEDPRTNAEREGDAVLDRLEAEAAQARAVEENQEPPAAAASSAGAPLEVLYTELRGIVNAEGFPAPDVKKFEALLLRRDLTEQQLRRAIAEASLILEMEGK